MDYTNTPTRIPHAYTTHTDIHMHHLYSHTYYMYIYYTHTLHTYTHTLHTYSTLHTHYILHTYITTAAAYCNAGYFLLHTTLHYEL